MANTYRQTRHQVLLIGRLEGSCVSTPFHQLSCRTLETGCGRQIPPDALQSVIGLLYMLLHTQRYARIYEKIGL